MTETNPLDNDTTYTFDAVNRLTAITRNPTVTFALDELGRVEAETDEMDETTTFELSAMGWPITVTPPIVGPIVTSFTPTGKPSGKINADNSCCDTVFDEQGRATAQNTHTSGAFGPLVTAFTHDALHLTSITTDDPDLAPSEPSNGPLEPSITSFTYTAQGWLQSEEDPSGHVIQYEYDLAGNLISITASPPMEYEYDAQNRLITIIDQEGGETHYAYDLAGRLISVTDPEDNITQYEYDDADRLIVRTDPRDQETLYTYDDAGQLTNVVDRNARETRYTYDTLGRRTKEEWLNGMTVIRTIDFEYDDASRMTSASDPDSAYAMEYDALGRMTSIDNDGTPGVPNVVLESTYLVTSLRSRVEDNLGAAVAFHYAEASNTFTGLRYTQDSDAVDLRVSMTLDGIDRVTSIERRDHNQPSLDPVITNFTYDSSHRVTEIAHTFDETELATFEYTYNLRGDITDYAGPGGDVEYAYDDTRQLTGATGDRTESYSYDSNGNRVSSHLHDDDYETGTNNRLLSDGEFDYEYDDEGNRISKTEIATGTVTTYTWDHRNRLTSVVVTNASEDVILEAQFTYDVFNNLIIREVDADGEGSGVAEVLATVYDGLHPWADFDGEGELLHHYVYGEAVDQIMARVDADGNFDLYLTDNLGSVRQIVEPDGTILDEIDYDSFGNIVSESAPSEGDRFKFTAREWEAAVDLYFYRARWYDSAIGRFISEDPLYVNQGLFDPENGSWLPRDPIGYGGGVNLFRYVENAPALNTDPSGMVTCVPSTPPAMWPRKTLSVTAAAGGLDVGVSLNPGTWDFEPTHTILCSRTRLVDVRYTCTKTTGWCFSRKTTKFNVTVTLLQTEMWEENIAPEFVFVVGIDFPLPLPRTFPSLDVSWKMLKPGSDQARADQVCKSREAFRPWPPFTPPETIER